MTRPDQTYETSDLWLAAYLSTLDSVQLSGLKNDPERNRKLFVFSCNSGIFDLVLNYYNHTSAVDPLEYKNKINDLRNLLTSKTKVGE